MKPNSEDAIKEILDVGRRLLDGVAFSEVYLKDLFEKHNFLIFYKNQNSEFLGCNKRLARVTKIFNPFSIIGKTDYDVLVSKEEADRFRGDDQHVLFHKKAKLDINESIQQINQKEINLLTSKFLICSSNKKRLGVMGVAIDLTEYHLLEEKLLKQKRDV